MTLELNAEDLELILHALKQHGRRPERDDPSRVRIDGLVAKLEVVQRQNRGGAGARGRGPMNGRDVDEVRVLRAGERLIVHVPGGRGEELRVHLEAHGIRSAVRPASQPPYERLEVEGDADEEVLRALVDRWEG